MDRVGRWIHNDLGTKISRHLAMFIFCSKYKKV